MELRYYRYFNRSQSELRCYPLFLYLLFIMTDSTTLTQKEKKTLSPPSQIQKLESVGLFLNRPEPAIICKQCGFAIHPNRVLRHPGDTHDVSKPARRGLKAVLSLWSLPDPGSLPLRPDGSRPHPHLAIQRGSACKHCGLRSISDKVLATHVRTYHSDKIQIATRLGRHWLRDHIH